MVKSWKRWTSRNWFVRKQLTWFVSKQTPSSHSQITRSPLVPKNHYAQTCQKQRVAGICYEVTASTYPSFMPLSPITRAPWRLATVPHNAKSTSTGLPSPEKSTLENSGALDLYQMDARTKTKRRYIYFIRTAGYTLLQLTCWAPCGSPRGALHALT